jgi:hypothetical protein
VPDGPASGRASRRYPYYRIFVDLRFRTGTKKLHCEVALSGRVQCGTRSYEDREVSRSAPSDDSLSTVYSGSDPRYADLEFDDAALVLSELSQPRSGGGLRCLFDL